MKYKYVFKLMKYLVLLFIWILLQLITLNNELANDGYLKIGFPFVFYTDFNGKTFNLDIVLGLQIFYLFFDLLIFYVFMFLINIIYKKLLNFILSTQ